MAKDIHPKIFTNKAQFTTGQVFDFNSTSDLGTFTIQIGPWNHTAWTGETKLNTNEGNVAGFLKRMKVAK